MEYIRPLELHNKAKIIDDLNNIENSWSGRMDGNVCNRFILESEQLIINSLHLFELGYFDAAYYSLRASIELSTTMNFLDDMPEKERTEWFTKWKCKDYFPVQGKMSKQLKEHGIVFSDMQRLMPEFFSDVKDINSRLNKYVHKQGFDNFYVLRNHHMNTGDDSDNFVSTFEYYVKKCIGIVAVMRLVIDPFPILLMDEDILYRCFDSMTGSYDEAFVDDYIGKNMINEYKKTRLYIGTYDSFIHNEKKNQAVFDIVCHQYIDSREMHIIKQQLHLLSVYDLVAVLLVDASKKTIKVYSIGGFLIYLTDRHTNRKSSSWSSGDFDAFSKSTDHINIPYDEAFISVFTFVGDDYYVEHNEPLVSNEYQAMLDHVLPQLEALCEDM